MADYYQQAIDAAKRGDKKAAEDALNAREQKMRDPNYRGTGGGTSMDAARANIASILAGSGASNAATGGKTTTGGRKTFSGANTNRNTGSGNRVTNLPGNAQPA